jgi:uncharacterized membrane protein
MLTRSKILAALSYLGILCFVPLLLGGNDRFIHFHARQGLVIWIWGVVALFLLPLPFGRLVFGFSSTAVMIFSVLGLVSVALGQRWRLPIVHELSEKL